MTGPVIETLSRGDAGSGATVLRGVQIGLAGRRTDLRIEGRWISAIGNHLPTARADNVVDAEGAVALPGLWDAHVHAVQWATARRRVDITAATSAEHAARLIAEANDRADGTAMIVGYGFRDSSWAAPLHKDVLDRALPGAVVALISNDLHVVCLSPAALTLVGRPDHPTGVFEEADALAQIAALPMADDATIDTWLHDAMFDAARRGVTGLLDFEVSDNLTAWQRRHRRRPLPMRVTAAVYPDYLDAAIAQQLRTGQTVPGSDGMLEVGPLKIFVDGSLNAQSALCHDPYGDSESASYGTVTTSPADLQALMRHGAAHGLLPAVHAIGDRAVSIALDAFESVGCPGRIEHAQLVRQDDLPRLRRLGITVGVQPAHITGDRDVADRLWAGRTARAFAVGDMVRQGVTVEIGSDAPVAPLDPWLGIASAVHRTTSSRASWHPEQAVPLPEALVAAARGRRTVRVGDPADLVLTDGDLAAASPAELATTRVLGTIVDGRWTHRDADLG